MGAAVEVEVARALCAVRFFWASAVRLFSAARAPVVSLLRQVGRSRARDSQVLRLMSKSLRDTLRQSLNRFFCPPTERLP